MKCLRSGFCCFNYDVIIVDNPELGIALTNLKPKPNGVRCQHLTGEKSGEFSCSIHHYNWYRETPCYAFTQIEINDRKNCRMGEYLLEYPVNPEMWKKE